MKDDLQWKTTSNGRQPQMEDNLKWKTTSNGRQPPMNTTSNGRKHPMKDDLKILKVEFLSNTDRIFLKFLT
jgi:hypothetical protein